MRHAKSKRIGQAVYLQLNNEAHSGNRCCSGKATSIRYPEYAFLALGIQHEMRMRHIVICDLSGSTIFLHIIS